MNLTDMNEKICSFPRSPDLVWMQPKKLPHLLSGPSCGTADTPGCPVEFGQTWRSKRRSACPVCSSASSSPPHRPPYFYTRLETERERETLMLKRTKKAKPEEQLISQNISYTLNTTLWVMFELMKQNFQWDTCCPLSETVFHRGV